MGLMGRTADERRRERMDRRLELAAPLIPQGMYCYTRVPDPEGDARRAATGIPYIPGRYVMCPFWEQRADKPSDQNGYCRAMKAGDWMGHPNGTMLLFDQCKECGVNDGIDEDEDHDEDAMPSEG